MAIWDKPLYHLVAENGKPVIIDVTQSVQSGLGPNQAIYEVIEFFKRKKVKRILDFGAGAFRHTFPFLEAGFQVWAVDFEEQYADTKSKQVCRKARQKVENDQNFNELIYPRDFIKYKLKNKMKFHAALLCYTLQGMPLQNERRYLLRLLYGKLRPPSPKRNSYIVWMSRYGDEKVLPPSQRVEDGYFKYPKSSTHSFYKEWKTFDIHEMIQSVGWRKRFQHIKSLGKGGRDQIFVYSKYKKVRETWI